MILLIDNYDSFVYNLARYFIRLGHTTQVVRNDQIDVDSAHRLEPGAIVLSPGPCRPEQAGCCIELVRQLGAKVPILGVCLGHQAIAVAYGAAVIRADTPRHGQASTIYHDGQTVFRRVANPFVAGRYHSLIVDESSLPSELEVSARTEDGLIMALRHRKLPIVGLQFHPESILTECGYDILTGFLELAGLSGADRPDGKGPNTTALQAGELRRLEKPRDRPVPITPPTF